MSNPFDTNQWYQITSPRFENRSMVGPRTNGLGGKEAVFFKLTKNTSDGKLWQLFPTDNNTYLLRTKAARTNAYLAQDSNPSAESEIIMRDVNGASDEVFWKINRFTNGGYNLENVAKGTGWHLQAKDYENLTMTNNLAEQDNQKFQFTAFTDAGPINDPAFSSIKLPSGTTATVPGFADPTASQSASHNPSTAPAQGPAQDRPQEQSSDDGMSLGTKLGIGFGVAAAVLLIVGVLILLYFLRSRKRERKATAAKAHRTELDAIPPHATHSPAISGVEVGAQKYHLRELSAHLPAQELDSTERRPDEKR